MSGFSVHLEEYLQLRSALGHKLDHATRVLPRFVAFLDAAGARTITVELALAWVQQPEADPSSSVWMHRMGAVRGFARHMSGIDPANEIPPLGLVTFRRRWRQPFIYSDADIVALMEEVPRLVPTPFRVASFQTMIGLLATTGMRVGEVIALTRADVDWGEGVITVRNSKFNKSRELPLDPTTVEALGQYARLRDRVVPRPASAAFFISGKGTPVLYVAFSDKFRELIRSSGVGAASPRQPRIHDLRHSFAVNTLVRWHREGQDVGPLLPRLSTYLGHLTPGHTYWYLSAAPELLALAAARLEKRAHR
jgi:integrase